MKAEAKCLAKENNVRHGASAVAVIEAIVAMNATRLEIRSQVDGSTVVQIGRACYRPGSQRYFASNWASSSWDLARWWPTHTRDPSGGNVWGGGGELVPYTTSSAARLQDHVADLNGGGGIGRVAQAGGTRGAWPRRRERAGYAGRLAPGAEARAALPRGSHGTRVAYTGGTRGAWPRRRERVTT